MSSETDLTFARFASAFESIIDIVPYPSSMESDLRSSSTAQQRSPGIAMTDAIRKSRRLGEARQHGRSMTVIEGPPGGRTAPGVRPHRV